MGRAFRAAFPATVPVLLGYLSLGIAFGLLINAAGYGFLWAGLMSVTVYAGSAQFLGVEFLSTVTSLGHVAVMTFLLNFRHMVYGLSMLEKFRDMGRRKLYMIFSLSDETYALLASARPPVGVEPRNYYFAISLLDQLYWIAGAVTGALLGAVLPIDTTGADFAMTALFVVIAVGQWEETDPKAPAGGHLPALIGGAAAVGALLLFGPDGFLLPALAVIVVALLALGNRLDKGVAA